MIPMSIRFDYVTRKLKKTSNARKLIFKGFKIMFYAILSEMWDLDGQYCTNLGYKLVVMF